MTCRSTDILSLSWTKGNLVSCTTNQHDLHSFLCMCKALWRGESKHRKAGQPSRATWVKMSRNRHKIAKKKGLSSRPCSFPHMHISERFIAWMSTFKQPQYMKRPKCKYLTENVYFTSQEEQMAHVHACRSVEELYSDNRANLGPRNLRAKFPAHVLQHRTSK